MMHALSRRLIPLSLLAAGTATLFALGETGCSSSTSPSAGSGSGTGSSAGGESSGGASAGAQMSSGASVTSGTSGTSDTSAGGSGASGQSSGSIGGSGTISAAGSASGGGSGATTGASTSGVTAGASGSPADAGPVEFELTSPSYVTVGLDGGGGDGGPTIPPEDTCANPDAGGYGDFPGLAWSGAPAGTMSYVVVLHDLTNSFYHWAMWDIPASTTSLPEDDLPAGKMVTMPAGAMQNSFMGSQGQFTGPCPAGALHVYEFTLFALGTTTLPGVTATDAMSIYDDAKQVALATTDLVGRSNAKHY
jgi:Raf kinase inhibitor-like YbhB/YbcL family protein